MVLAGGEFTEINTENSKLIIDQLVDKFWWLYPMRELILDHGSELGAHRIHDDGSWNSEFKDHFKKYGIKPILARVKHPPDERKVRTVFRRIREAQISFCLIHEFITWYNDKTTRKLEFPKPGDSRKGFQAKNASGSLFRNWS
ncbi:MAG: hypothetical protein E4G89_02575 [Methanothrix sp.]|nr:MAG: hypothetical protein E4G89_02575 [Methanothrix sp.]